MNTKFKKWMSAALAAAVISAGAVVPSFAEAAASMSYKNGTLTITSDAAYDGAKIFVASYNDDNTLKNVAMLEQNINSGENNVSLAAAENDRIMLWKGTESDMDPICDAITVGKAVSENAVLYDFGSADNVADGYIGVDAAAEYSAAVGYGFLGLKNGYALDTKMDGWTMTQGFDLVLANGADSTVANADDDYVATTYDAENDIVSPIRFAAASESNTYYKVKINLRRADKTQEAKVNLFTEKRHQHLIDEPIPEAGLQYECSVYVHNNWSKSTYEYVDKMLNIVAEGKNVAISSIEIEKTEPGKTLFVLGDSTVCEQSASIPYFPLQQCQGVGSAMTKYLGKDWAVVNEAESGLSASASTSHKKNMINSVKPGDVVWFQFGHNDDKVTSDPATNGYLDTMESYYNEVTAKGGYFVAVGPIQRCTAGQYSNGVWNAALAQYSTAAKNFTEAKIAAGATNIAFVDLNALSLDFLNTEAAKIDNETGYGAESPRFYYFVSKFPGYKQDYTHPNDAGADVFAGKFVEGANEVIAAGGAQSEVLSHLLSGSRDVQAYSVPAEIYTAGKAPNRYYRSALAEVIYYDYPWLLKNVSWNEDGTPASVTVLTVACRDISSIYGKGRIEIYRKDGSLKGALTSDEISDATIYTDQTLPFTDKSTVYDASAGDTYKAFIIDIDQETFEPGTDPVSNTLTEKENYSVEKYLLQGTLGTENKEDFSSYTSTLSTGSSIIGTNGWSSAGDVNMILKEESGKYFASLSKGTTSNSHYMYKNLSDAVGSGKLMVQFDVRYREGVINFEMTNGASAPNNFPPLLMPIKVKQDGNSIGVYLDDELVANINKSEWTTIQYVIDIDNAKHTARVNGKSLEKTVPMFDTMEAPEIASFKTIAFVETTKSAVVDYDITNMIAATLEADELPDKTLTLSVDEASEGMGTVSGGGVFKMNSTATAVAVPNAGYEFECWKDTQGNVLSYAANYVIRMHNDLAAIASFKAANVDPINYTFIERFSTLTTGTLASNGWTSTNAQPYMTIQSDDEHGNYLQFAPANQNSRGMIKNFGVSLTSAYVVEMDVVLKAGNNQSGAFSIISTDASNGINDEANAYLLKLANSPNSTTWTINGTENTVVIPAEEWVHIKVVVGSDAASADLTITNGETQLYSGNVGVVGNGALKGIHVRSGRYNGVTKIDNVRVYTADQQ